MTPRTRNDAPPTTTRRPSATQPVVYLAEDDDDIRETLAALLAYDGFSVHAAPDGATMFDWLFRRRGPGLRLPDVIITDHRMPGYCALDILDGLAELRWTIPVIVITAFGSEVRSLARIHGVKAIFDKPFEPDDLRRVAWNCVNWNGRRPWPGDNPSDPRAEHHVTARAREALRHANPE